MHALLGDKGYDADWFRNALIERGITPCIPSRSNRKVPIPHDRTLYRQRHRIVNMFGKLKDWRRIHTRYNRCAHTFMSAICIAATVIFWFDQRVLTVRLYQLRSGSPELAGRDSVALPTPITRALAESTDHE